MTVGTAASLDLPNDTMFIATTPGRHGSRFYHGPGIFRAGQFTKPSAP